MYVYIYIYIHTYIIIYTYLLIHIYIERERDVYLLPVMLPQEGGGRQHLVECVLCLLNVVCVHIYLYIYI